MYSSSNVLIVGSRNKFAPNLASFIHDTSFNLSLTQESCVPFVLIKPVEDGHNWEKVKTFQLWKIDRISF